MMYLPAISERDEWTITTLIDPLHKPVDYLAYRDSEIHFVTTAADAEQSIWLAGR
mgnify:CR=1 FL=1